MIGSREILDDVARIRRIDQSHMFDIVEKTDEQVLNAYGIGRDLSLDLEGPQLQHIVVCGMGGSAIGADFLSSCFGRHLRLPFLVSRDYSIPPFVDSSTLVLASSYSGNTEETLAAFREALDRRANIICLTSGGELERLAGLHSLPLVKFPAGYPPRTAMAYSVFSTLALLSRLGVLSEQSSELERIRLTTTRCIGSFGRSSVFQRNPAKLLSVSLKGRTSVVYGSNGGLDAIARRWAGQFCENAKQLAYFAVLPEVSHNEIVGWKHPEGVLSGLNTIFLRDQADHPRVQRRADWLRSSVESRSGCCREIWSPSGSRLERFWSLILLGDFTSLYLAILNEEDPTPVLPIEELKERMRESGNE